MPAESERSCSTASSTTTRRKRSLVLWQRSHSRWPSTFHYAESRPRTAAILFRASLLEACRSRAQQIAGEAAGFIQPCLFEAKVRSGCKRRHVLRIELIRRLGPDRLAWFKSDLEIELPDG